MVASKHEALRLRLVHLVRDNGNELTSEEGNLVAELALALNTDTKLISDILYKLRQRSVLFFDRKPGGKTFGVFLEEGWEERMEAEYRKLPHLRPYPRLDEDDDVVDVEAVAPAEVIREPVEDTSWSVEPEDDEDDQPVLDNDEEDDDAEQIRLGQAMVRAAAQALAKVDEAEKIVDRFTELAQRSMEYDAAIQRADELDRRNLQLEDRLKELSIEVERLRHGNFQEAEFERQIKELNALTERLAADNKRLSDELKKRHTGNSVAERLTPGERQAMTRLMRELRQKGGKR